MESKLNLSLKGGIAQLNICINLDSFSFLFNFKKIVKVSFVIHRGLI